MAWEEKKEPKYYVDLIIEGIELTVEYDVANMNPDSQVWDLVNSPSEIYIKKILHQEVDIKRIVRGFPKQLITNMVYERHQTEG